jgi:hypothetical protein
MATFPALWVPAAIFAHIFASVWLFRAFQLFFRPNLFLKGQWSCKPWLCKVFLGPIIAASTTRSSSSQQSKSATSLIPCSSRTSATFELQDYPKASGHAAFDVTSTNDTTRSGVTLTLLPSVGPSDSGNSDKPGNSNSASSSSTASNSSPQGLPPVFDGQASISNLSSCHSSDDPSVSRVALPIATCSVQLQGLALYWQGVECSYKTNSGERLVLSDICGNAQAGQLQVGSGNRSIRQPL